MTEQTIVAVYDTAAHADAVIRELEAADVPSSAISRHAKGGTASAIASPAVETGFWASLFGGASDDDEVYGRSIESGSTVVTVKVPEQHIARVHTILEAHDPIDLDERAASYGSVATTTTTTAAPAMAAMPAAKAVPVATTDDETIKVMAETMTVGKRVVNRGGARIRSYVVETPVQEKVTLHSETVTLERRPVTDGRIVNAADFTDKVIEMTESREEAVVGKTVRVVEEIGLRKDSTERVETVSDTLRHTEVDVVQVPADVTTTKVAAAPVVPMPPKR